MRLGIFAKTFSGDDPLSVLRAAHQAGYAAVQYNMACSGLPAMPDSVPQGTVAAIVSATRETGVALAAVSGTYNMIHPDPAQRQMGLRRLSVLIDHAAGMGTGMVTLCTGSRDAVDQWRHHPDNQSAEAWRDLLAEMEKACHLAEARGVKLGIEPELANVVNNAVTARRLMNELKSPALAIVLDPANLFEISPPDLRNKTIESAIDLLADRIAMTHAKDRYADGSFATAGKGVVDFTHFIKHLKTAGFDGDLVTHGLSAEEAASVAAHLKDCGA